MTPCWHCTNFVALTAQGSAAACGRTSSRAEGAAMAWRVVATPARGCVYFVREVGVDDEPDWKPVPLSHAQLQAYAAARPLSDLPVQLRLKMPEL
jgi:hypothetical protein